MRTPQFWLLWAVLFLNVTAGIGILEQAAPMIQEMFPGLVTAAAAAGFVGLLSLFNMAGRFAWSSCSDRIGRKPTYAVFFALGSVLYALIPATGEVRNLALFVAACAVIMSMYGGGFATIPAYLRDLFGTARVGAIHGRLLTAWSLAGVAGPVLVNEIRDYQIRHGVPPADAYTLTMYLIAGSLVVGFVCNWLVRPAAVPAPPSAGMAPGAAAPESGSASEAPPAPGAAVTLAFRWAWVGVPLAWGVWTTVEKSLALFR
jgi:MFS family permease